jgi:hypothetical protein
LERRHNRNPAINEANMDRQDAGSHQESNSSAACACNADVIEQMQLQQTAATLLCK